MTIIEGHSLWVGGFFYYLEIIMRISRQADYAKRTIYYLTRLSRIQQDTTKSIAEAQKIPPTFLAKIISRLSVVGLIRTSHGSRGCVSDARSSTDTSLLDEVEAIDGADVLHESVTDFNDCEYSEDFPSRPVWCEIQETLVNQLQYPTLYQFEPNES